jgi:hypothetical protein
MVEDMVVLLEEVLECGLLRVQILKVLELLKKEFKEGNNILMM